MSSTAPPKANQLVLMRNPTAKPTSEMMTITTTLRHRSAVVRPASTADRAMGSDRNRSMSPFCRSSASPMLVLTEPNITVCTKMPAMR